MRRPNAILFDAGGTLVLQNPLKLSQLLHIPVDPVRAFEAHYRAMDAYARLRLAGEERSWVWWQGSFFGDLGLADPDSGAGLTNNGYGIWTAAIEGAVDAIIRLRAQGIRTAVISNSDGSVREALSQAGFDGLFEFVLDSHEAGVSKPDPVIFNHGLERLGVGASEAWYVGDSAFHDVGGATRAGMASVLVDPLRLSLDHPFRIDSVAELPDLFTRMP